MALDVAPAAPEPVVDEKEAHAEGSTSGPGPDRHFTREISGWTVHVNERLREQRPERVEGALELLEVQLDRVVEAVPAPVLRRLRTVPIWINPPPEGARPKAVYHPDRGWLEEHGRDPAMAEAIELTNVSRFLFEHRRMPSMLLHELAHAWHHQVLGVDHPDVKAAYRRARKSGSYEEVKRFTGREMIVDEAYAMTNHKEYFAETTEAYFGRNDFFPFERAELEEHDPRMSELLGRLWRPEAGESE